MFRKIPLKYVITAPQILYSLVRERRKFFPDLTLLAFIGLLLGSGGGLPFYHPDAIKNRAIYLLFHQGRPDYFDYPGLVLYIHAAVYGAWNLCLKFFNRITFGGIPIPDGISYIYVGWILTILIAICGIIAIYGITFMVTQRRLTSLFSGLFLATAFLWVANAHYVTVDIPLAVLCVLSVGFFLVLTRNAIAMQPVQLILPGAIAGFAASAKYPGAIVILALLPAIALYYRSDIWKGAESIALFCISAAATFLLTNPYAILEYPRFISSVLFQSMRFGESGEFGYTTANGYLFHTLHSFPHGYGIIPSALAILGFLWVLKENNMHVHWKIALIGFPALFFLVMGHSVLAFERYMLPVIPFLAIFSAFGLHSIGIFLERRNGLRQLKHIRILVPALLLFLFLIAASPGLADSIRHDTLLSQKDTRSDLLFLLNDMKNEGTFAVFGGQDLFTKEGELMSNVQWFSRPLSFSHFTSELDTDLQRDPSQMFIFDSFSHDRLLYEPAGQPLQKSYVGWNNLTALQITPFTTGKEEVPFSPESLFSPYPPDLPFRNRPGPFIEIYFKDSLLAQRFWGYCRELHIQCTVHQASDGYYLPRLSALYMRQPQSMT
jgi:hypothetical protein